MLKFQREEEEGDITKCQMLSCCLSDHFTYTYAGNSRLTSGFGLAKNGAGPGRTRSTSHAIVVMVGGHRAIGLGKTLDK